MNKQFVVAATAIAALSGAAFADGRIWAQDASGRYNGTDGAGGAFIMHRIGNSISAAGTWTQTNSNAYHTAQGGYGGSGYVGSGLGQQGLGSDAFYTFCMERSENINLGNTNGSANRFFSVISRSAKAGGSIADPTGTDSGPDVAGEDQLSYATAAVYREFRSNGNFGGIGSVLGGHLYTASSEQAGREMSTAIQWTIWYLEGEMTLADITGNGLNSGKIRKLVLGNDLSDDLNDTGNDLGLVGWARANHFNNLHGVRVLRNWKRFRTSDGAYLDVSQDMLTLIPLPSTAALAGLGILGIGARVRRRAF